MKDATFVILPEGYVTACEGDDRQDQMQVVRCLIPDEEDPYICANKISDQHNGRQVLVW